MGLDRLVVTDLDGTLLGDDAALQRFSRWLGRDRAAVGLVYATGRHLDEVKTAVIEDGLPEPDVVIGALGTEIIDWPDRDWASWSDRFDPAHGERVRAALEGIDWLELQPGIHQSDRKASYFCDALGARQLQAVERLLADLGIEARLIYSADRFLDVLPAGSGKGPATAFLASALGVPRAGVLTFGDSGNDLDLLAMEFSATIVANALPEVRAAVSPGVYRSALPFADGVLDGIEHWTGRASGLPREATPGVLL